MTSSPTQIIDQTLPTPDSLAASLGRLLEQATQSGATSAAATMSISVGLTVTVRGGDVEAVEFQRDRDLSLTAYRGQRTGSASSADWSEESLAEVVDRALAISQHTGEDPYAGLPDPAHVTVKSCACRLCVIPVQAPRRGARTAPGSVRRNRARSRCGGHGSGSEPCRTDRRAAP